MGIATKIVLTAGVAALVTLPVTVAAAVPPTPAVAPPQAQSGQANDDPAAGTPTTPAEPTNEPVAGTSATPAAEPKKEPTAGTPTPSAKGKNGSPTRGGDKSGGVRPVGRPVLGKSMGVKAVSGTIKVRVPNGTGYVRLDQAGSIPPGSVVDARHGQLELRTAIAGGGTQTATFWGAVFEIRQAHAGNGMTDIVLRGGPPAGCPARSAARARAASLASGSRRPRSRSLWAKDNQGRFRTRGRNSVAIVRGTKWLTKETCAGTLTRVTHGVVVVRDTRRRKSVTVRAGHSYLARDASPARSR